MHVLQYNLLSLLNATAAPREKNCKDFQIIEFILKQSNYLKHSMLARDEFDRLPVKAALAVGKKS